ncbi:MAG: AAA family ATPase [SAR324 cluster bacterium]|nr:AAA family ATPase [SAR324 cluster bacterium]
MSISLDHFSPNVQEALLKSQQYAVEHGYSKVFPEHFLYCLLTQTESMASAYLEKLNIPVSETILEIENWTKSRQNLSTPVTQAYISRELHGVILRAEKEASLFSETYTNTEHMLLSLLLQKSGLVYEIFERHHVSYDQFKSLLANLTRQETSALQSQGSEKQVLERYCADMIDLARKNKLDPVIGRDEEVRRVIQILSRRTKNNPILIGEPGVGKTAIVECLANRIVSGDLPETLKGKSLYSLDLGALVAGTNLRGEFENRVKQLLREIEAAAGEIILFIDEIHLLVGAGGSEGHMDAANMLKPALARGQLRCIGATTIKEFKKYVEKDAALVRRFQQINVAEPSVDSTIAILRGLKSRYEVHHGVRIKDSALIAAAILSQRYVTERFLPDKAVDLIDEAASNLRIQIDSMPTEIDQIERKITQFEIERTVLRREDDAASRARLKQLQHQLTDLRDTCQNMKERWQTERTQLREVSELKERIEKTRIEEQEAQRQGDLELAAKLRYETLNDLEHQLRESALFLDRSGRERMLKEEVDEEDIALVVSQWTGIPIVKMLENEKQKLLHMEQRLAEKVVGQSEAINSVAHAIRRTRAGVQDPERPIGSFIFLGSSGIGKTELAYALAEFLFDDHKSLIRFDMSEYMEKHSVTRLIGAPPGYVGFEEGGLLTEAIRQRPYAVLLFDEIEKAHPDVFNLFLQILDNGRLTDSQGRITDFKNTIIILTTNLGHEVIQEHPEQDVSMMVRNVLLANFRPEFLNRLDEIIVFKPLALSHIRQICKLQMYKLEQRLMGQRIRLWLSEHAELYLAQKGYDAAFGARPLKRLIQREIQDVLAGKILEGSLSANHLVKIEVDHGKLLFLVDEWTKNVPKFEDLPG